jgi:serine/threonine-protein kinase
MATVYLAQDIRHDRPVAMKVLHPELTASIGAERFLREVHTTARLDHPHILPLLDSGETEGLLWYTMPYVEGQTLRERLRREGQLSIEHALRITSEVADALDYAHEHRVVHRDIKPENILLARGHARVADFGIARAVEAAGGQLTQTGMAVGTPAYMSPEQASGAPVDARSDIYALGCVLYEMMAGEPPFTGPTPQAVIARRFTETPRPLHATRDRVPAHVEDAVAKALARTPADRYETAAEFARALANPSVLPAFGTTAVSPGPSPTADRAPLQEVKRRRQAAAAAALGLLLLIGIAGLFAWRSAQHDGGTTTAATKPASQGRIAVLPFENLGDSADSYFADGVADEVRGKLAALPGIEVIARSSSAQYRHTPKPPPEIARELGVRYLLTGTVRWERRPGAEGRVRVSPELVEAASGTTRWQQPFDAPLTDVFQVQGDIAARVAEALGVALRAGERERLAERPTGNFDAYARYLRGRELTSGENTPEALRAAAAEYRAAVRLDPAFAAAWAALAVAHTDLFRLGGMQVADTRLAQEAVERATALAPESPDTRLAAARYADFVTGDAGAALSQLRAGLEVAPGRADLLAAVGGFEVELGRTAEGLGDLEHAARLDPRSPAVLSNLAGSYLSLNRLPEAETAITRARALRPGSMELAHRHARILAAKGDLEGVQRVLRTMEQALGARPVVAYVALREELIPLLDSTRLRRMLTLTPADLDNGYADWALALAEGNWLLGNKVAARSYGDTAAAAYAAQGRSVGSRLSARDRAMQVALRALALAYAGRAAQADAAARAAAEPQADNYVHYVAARAHLVAGDLEQALDQLELIASGRLRGAPTKAWLRIDPTFALLRGNPRFERLVNES